MQRLTNLFKYICSMVKLLAGGYRSNRKFPLQMVIGRNCRFKGKGTMHISKGFVARDNCRLEAGIGGAIEIGVGCFLNNNVCITAMGDLKIGDGVTIGNNVVIIDHNHNYKHEGVDLFVTKPVKIGNGVWIGANVTVLPGTVLEDGVVVGAGTVVSGSIPKNAVVYNECRKVIKVITDDPS